MAAPVNKAKFTQDINAPIKAIYGGGLMFSKDNLSNVISVDIVDGGQPFEVTGTVAGTVIRSDGTTVPVYTGAISGNTVSLTLTKACFDVPGQTVVNIIVTNGDVKCCVLRAVYTVVPTETSAVVDPGDILPSIADLMDDIDAAVASIPADYSGLLASIAGTFSPSKPYVAGEYVWNEGTLYRFTADHAAGSWTGSDATSVTISGEVTVLKNAIGDLSDLETTDKTNLVTAINEAAESGGAPAIVDTASGAVASFDDGADGLSMQKLTVNVKPVQAGSGDPSPDNVRPISGWTGADVRRTGKNYLPIGEATTIQGVTYTPNLDGSISVKGTSTGTEFYWFYLNEGTSFLPFNTSFVVTAPEAEPNLVIQVMYKPTAEQGYSYLANLGNVVAASFTTPAASPSIAARMYVPNGATVDTVVHPMIRLASDTDDTFVPYQGNQISVAFPSSAGTVYGGVLAVNEDWTGSLKVDKSMVDLGTLDWAYLTYQGISRFATTVNGLKPPKTTADVNAICSEYPVIKQSDSWVDKICCITTTGQVNILDNSYSTAADFKLAMSGIQLVYELVTPIAYTLTKSEISGILTTRYGTNNIWSDAGDTTVDYVADTKLYIEKLTQPTEDDMTADHLITNGTFFMVGNSLYLATAQIAAGATITPGTNATKLSLADALNALNS